MSKELDEAWTTIYHYNDEIIHDLGSEYIENPLKEELDIVNNALLELKAIKEANPSEALKGLKHIKKYYVPQPCSCRTYDYLEIIEQVLLKAQEQEKENARNEEILQKYYQEGITLDSVRALKQERDTYKKVLSIIKDKCLTNCNLALVKNNVHYELYCWEFEYFLNKYNESHKGFKITKEDLLTEEEFDLLKRWLG